MYGAGHLEELVGEAVKRGKRSSLLTRLNTNYIDLYQVHAPNPSIPIRGTMSAMEYLVDEGKIKFISVSNSYGTIVFYHRIILHRYRFTTRIRPKASAGKFT